MNTSRGNPLAKVTERALFLTEPLFSKLIAYDSRIWKEVKLRRK